RTGPQGARPRDDERGDPPPPPGRGATGEERRKHRVPAPERRRVERVARAPRPGGARAERDHAGLALRAEGGVRPRRDDRLADLGQGLKVLVLVTTNEEIRRLHPAVARPGRSAANIEFLPLSADESNAWLERHGLEERVQSATTLASLYARREGFDPGATTASPISDRASRCSSS